MQRVSPPPSSGDDLILLLDFFLPAPFSYGAGFFAMLPAVYVLSASSTPELHNTVAIYQQ